VVFIVPFDRNAKDDGRQAILIQGVKVNSYFKPGSGNDCVFISGSTIIYIKFGLT
jgi:hypothetical protein